MMATYSTEPPREEIEIKLKAGIARMVVFESSGNPGTPWKPVEWPGANQVLVQRKACVRGDKVTSMTFVGALHEMSPKSPEVIDAVVKNDRPGSTPLAMYPAPWAGEKASPSGEVGCAKLFSAARRKVSMCITRGSKRGLAGTADAASFSSGLSLTVAQMRS